MNDISDNALSKNKKGKIRKILTYGTLGVAIIGLVDYMNLPTKLMGTYDSGKEKIVDVFTRDSDERYESLVSYVDENLKDMSKENQQKFLSRYNSKDSMMNYKTLIDSTSVSGIDSILFYASQKIFNKDKRIDYTQMFFDGLDKNDKWKFTKYASKDLAVDIFNGGKNN